MVDLITTVEDTVTVVTIEEDMEVVVVSQFTLRNSTFNKKNNLIIDRFNLINIVYIMFKDMASIMVDSVDEVEVELAILVVAADAA